MKFTQQTASTMYGGRFGEKSFNKFALFKYLAKTFGEWLDQLKDWVLIVSANLGGSWFDESQMIHQTFMLYSSLIIQCTAYTVYLRTWV